MNVFIRADASARIGGGHAVRCLTLADELRRRGADCCFVARQMPDQLAARIAARGHELLRLDCDSGASQEEDAIGTVALLRGRVCDWLIVDHYSLDSRWERKLGTAAGAVMAIDDLADRPHACQVLLDQNYYADATTRYDGLLPPDARCLLGPQYALLNPQFAATRAGLKVPESERLFVSAGASDPYGICQRAVDALRMLGGDAPGAEIVVGTDETLRENVANTAIDLHDVRVHGFVDDIATLMARCTIAIGAGGSSTWERCALGLPSLVVITADNQRRMAHDLADARVIVLLGETAAVSASDLAAAIAQIRNQRQRQSQMRAAGMELVDGLGVRRVADQLVEMQTCSN